MPARCARRTCASKSCERASTRVAADALRCHRERSCSVQCGPNTPLTRTLRVNSIQPGEATSCRTPSTRNASGEGNAAAVHATLSPAGVTSSGQMSGHVRRESVAPTEPFDRSRTRYPCGQGWRVGEGVFRGPLTRVPLIHLARVRGSAARPIRSVLGTSWVASAQLILTRAKAMVVNQSRPSTTTQCLRAILLRNFLSARATCHRRS